MRIPWNKLTVEQLDFVNEANINRIEARIQGAREQTVDGRPSACSSALPRNTNAVEGLPLLVSVNSIDEDSRNPRTEFPDEEISELSQDVALRGILQPIVVLPLGDGRYRVLFGARRLRAAKQAGLEVVPVVIGSEVHDAYAQVAENQKRHGLTPLDLARFMCSRAEAGESNAEIAKRLGIDQTTIAHHLALLTLPPELDEAFRSGRCTSPRTLYELAKLHETKPEQVAAIVKGEREITRRTVASLKKAPQLPRVAPRKRVTPPRRNSLAERAGDLCARLESVLVQMSKPGAPVTSDELTMLRRRLADLAHR
ncbi:MAG: ParB/RepB/Spo0J family partition protein [Caldimonas sp.]